MRAIKVTFGLLLAVGLFAAPSFVSVASAQDAEPAAQESATFDETLLEIPDGETGQFYIDRIQAIGKAFNLFSVAKNDPDAVKELQPKAEEAIAKLVKKVAFADDLEYGVAKPYLLQYTLPLAREGKIDELKEILKAELGKDKVESERVGWLRYLVNCSALDHAKDVDALKAAIKDLDADVAEDDFVAARAEEFASIISANNPDEAKAFLQRTLEAFKASDSDARKKLAAALEPQIRFFSLVGNEMIFEGVYDDGSEIDWKSYRGKVVLVDFWATWCGPCVAEVPNVLALYEKYHDAGFDVVGYSLDNDLDALEKFEKERNLPWRTGVRKLSMQANEKDGKNYTNLTEYYGIHSIPTMILVDRDGKALDTHARGAHLKELLEKAFPDVK